MRTHTLALALALTLVPRFGDASERCTDFDRQLLLMTAPQAPPEIQPFAEHLKGCLLDLEADISAIRRRLAVEAKRNTEQQAENAPWAFVIPGARSQAASTRPGDAPVDEYLFDAKGALNRLERWLTLVGTSSNLKLNNCDTRDLSNVPTPEQLRKMADITQAKPSEVAQMMATWAGRQDLRADLDSAPAADAKVAESNKKLLADADVLDVVETSCRVKNQLHDLLRERGLRPRLLGVVVPAVNFTRSGDGGHASGTAASAHVELASRHSPRLWDQWSAPRVAWVGRVGYRQVFHLVAPAAGEAGKPPSNEKIASGTVPQFDSAFVWDMGAKLGWWIHNAGEASLTGRIGQSNIGGDAQIKKSEDGALATLVVPTDKSGAGVWYREVSARAALFRDRTDHAVVAYELGVLRPMASVEYGWRWDDQLEPPRFSSVTDQAEGAALRQTVSDRFGAKPRKRQFLRFALSGVPVAGLDTKSFSLSFAVEHEWHAWGNKPGVAAGTKIYLQGTLELANILKGL